MGAFVVLEAVDLAGKSTQLAALAEVLRARALSVVTIGFPDRSLPLTGPLIDGYLAGRALTAPADPAEAMIVQGLFSLNRREAATEVLALLADHDLVLCSRYNLSGLVYAEANGLEAERIEALQAGLEIDLPQPDLTFVLDLDPGVLRTRPRSGGLDRFEADLALQERVRAIYQRRADERIRLVDASGDPAAVNANLLAAYEQARSEGRLP